MKFFFETAALLLLVFLFQGEPDVWDTLHAQVMRGHTQECK